MTEPAKPDGEVAISQLRLKIPELRLELRDALEHWKNDTRGGDELVMAIDIAIAIDALIKARIDEAVAQKQAEFAKHYDEIWSSWRSGT